MQIRCQQCHKPFALTKAQIHAALDVMALENMNHFNAACSHCRRINRVSRKDLIRQAPDWSPPESVITKKDTSA